MEKATSALSSGRTKVSVARVGWTTGGAGGGKGADTSVVGLPGPTELSLGSLSAALSPASAGTHAAHRWSGDGY